MVFCTNCGKEIDQKAVVCPHCGVSQITPVPDNGGFGYGMLGCCIPMIGLILFLVWKDDKPKTAKSAGIGALVGAILNILFFVVWYGIIIAISMSY